MIQKVAILTGTTAAGKSQLAMDFCRQNPGIEIINADSIQVYRGFDIGSAKPDLKDRTEVTHHLINICSPNETFTAGDFHPLVNDAIEEIHSRNHRALIVGGTGFYLKTLLYGLWDVPKILPKQRNAIESYSNEKLMEIIIKEDPGYAKKLSDQDRYRLIRACEIIISQNQLPSELESSRPIEANPMFAYFAIDRTKEELNARIEARSKRMIENGILDETQILLSEYPGARALKSVGYQQCVNHLQDIEPKGREIAPGLDGLFSEICLATRQLVKKQRTWLRGEKNAQWFGLQAQYNDIWKELEKIYT